MRLLFVAADKMEFTGILARSHGPAEVKLDLRWARSARLGEHEVLLVANGVGAKRAGAATDLASSRMRPNAIISIGFCGALDEVFQIADIVLATEVNGHPSLPLTGATPCRQGVVRSIDHIARTAAEKTRLRESGACAVEMEAAGVAERAEAWGAPFYCIKAVTDLAGEDLANDFNSALRSDGHFDTIQVLTRAFRRPAVRVPELLRLRNRCIRAAQGLGDFFADCRF